MFLELDIERSLSEFNVGQLSFHLLSVKMTIFQHSKLDPGVDLAMIADFVMTLKSIPTWLSPYSAAAAGCVHRIFATMKLNESESNYEDFTKYVGSLLSALQFNSLEWVFFCLLIQN
jgi:hypothetical protein